MYFLAVSNVLFGGSGCTFWRFQMFFLAVLNILFGGIKRTFWRYQMYFLTVPYVPSEIRVIEIFLTVKSKSLCLL